MITIDVELGDRAYPVVVGTGARQRLADVLPAGATRAAIVTQEAIPFQVDPGIEHRVFAIADGEAGKALGTVEGLARRLAQWGLTRRDVVVGVGGGLVTDVAGFTAAIYHRGTRVVHVATTLLAMVDAAIGGKTGVNLPEGKNLVGAFWQPEAVLCDLDALATLPDGELRSGQGEMAKYHFLTGDDLAALPLEERVARCVAIKAEVVAADERDEGTRAVLNYGHTLGHALEVATGFRLTHGEAVAVGLVYAARLARVLGRVGDEVVEHHDQVVGGVYGLPTTLPSGVEAEELVALMGRDKKAIDGLTFVLDGPRGIEAVADVPRGSVLEAFARMGR